VKEANSDPGEPLIKLRCEKHTYGDGTVGMHDIDFEVNSDEVVAVVGGNGVGKSTLLEHLNATLVPDEGELVVVLDEPLAGLDPERSRLVADRIQQIYEDGISVVLSTHDLEFAADIADRVCVMAEGNIVGSGTPREVFYDDSLLDEANIHPPTAVRVARDLGVATTVQPVTEEDLVSVLTGDGGTESLIHLD